MASPASDASIATSPTDSHTAPHERNSAAPTRAVPARNAAATFGLLNQREKRPVMLQMSVRRSSRFCIFSRFICSGSIPHSEAGLPPYAGSNG